jgi:hypothetical protein
MRRGECICFGPGLDRGKNLAEGSKELAVKCSFDFKAGWYGNSIQHENSIPENPSNLLIGLGLTHARINEYI